jgi:hypothetical protein
MSLFCLFPGTPITIGSTQRVVAAGSGNGNIQFSNVGRRLREGEVRHKLSMQTPQPEVRKLAPRIAAVPVGNRKLSTE